MSPKILPVIALCFYASSIVTGKSQILLDQSQLLQEHELQPEVRFGAPVGQGQTFDTRDIQRKCKTSPTSTAWPSNSQWQVLSKAVGGRLSKPLPAADPCYFGPVFNEDECVNILSNWTDSDFHADHLTSIMFPLYTGLACIPTTDPNSGNCTQGTYPIYVVDAQQVSDIQAAVNFARNQNIRLVIKNSGHDFAGKSAGFGSLSIRTFNFKNITLINNYNCESYSGPAFKIGAGVQIREIYAAAHSHGLMVVGGEGQTIGFSGGYVTGGGHSPLSSIHGMAADSVLSMEVVLADGQFVTTSAQVLPDLFWALRGGGGSTFAVTVSVTVKAYPEIPIAISQFDFGASERDNAGVLNGDLERPDFWEVVAAYFKSSVDQAAQGIYAYWNIGADPDGNISFSMVPFFAPQHTAASVAALLKPMVDKAQELSIPLEPNTTLFDNFYDAWLTGFPQETVGTWFLQGGSRLFPRENYVNDTLFNATMDAIKNEGNNNGFIIGLSLSPTAKAGGFPDNAILPAWRDTNMHIIDSIVWSPDLRNLTEIDALRNDFTFNRLQKWRDVAPNSGVYLGETDINEPNFQQAFWGANYPRLYSIKQKYDPLGVFFAETAVGSENWSTGPERTGLLCPVDAS